MNLDITSKILPKNGADTHQVSSPHENLYLHDLWTTSDDPENTI